MNLAKEVKWIKTIHYMCNSSVVVLVMATRKKVVSLSMVQYGVTKHKDGMGRNGIYRNEPEYTGTRQNDAGMKRNGQEWNRNVPERARMTSKYTEMSRSETGMNTNMVD